MVRSGMEGRFLGKRKHVSIDFFSALKRRNIQTISLRVIYMERSDKNNSTLKQIYDHINSVKFHFIFDIIICIIALTVKSHLMDKSYCAYYLNNVIILFVHETG